MSGSTSGSWVNPNPTGGTIVTTGVGTSTFGWGDGSVATTGANSLWFAGGPFASVTETPFKVGTINYFNGTTAIGSTPDTVDLALTLNFGTPRARRGRQQLHLRSGNYTERLRPRH